MVMVMMIFEDKHSDLRMVYWYRNRIHLWMDRNNMDSRFVCTIQFWFRKLFQIYYLDLWTCCYHQHCRTDGDDDDDDDDLKEKMRRKKNNESSQMSQRIFGSKNELAGLQKNVTGLANLHSRILALCATI
jgi:hypothetical protein